MNDDCEIIIRLFSFALVSFRKKQHINDVGDILVVKRRSSCLFVTGRIVLTSIFEKKFITVLNTCSC